MSLPTQTVTYPPKRVAVWPRFFALLGLLPIGLVGWVVATYAANLPYWDDFTVQEHLLNVKNSSGRQQLKHLFDQHWEHRIVWTRLIFALFAKINGLLNYHGLTLIGVSGLLIVLGTLFAVFRWLAYPLLYFVPVPFLLITLQSYENLIWAMASIQNFWVLAFALGTFYGLAQNTQTTRWLAVGLGVLATFTSGNGSLVLIAGLFVLAYQRHWYFLRGWSFISVLSLAGYFFSYNRISFFPSPFRYPITDWIKAFFIFLGAFGDPSPNAGNGPWGFEVTVWLTVVLGALAIAMVSVFLLSVARQSTTTDVDKPGSFFLGCFLFLVATAAITVYSRIGFAGPGYLLQGRYKVCSALMLSLVYLYSLHRWRRKVFLSRYVIGVLLISIGQSLFSDYLCLEGIINQHRRVVAEYFNYLANTPPERQQEIRQVFRPTEQPFFNNQVVQLSSPAWWWVPAGTDVNELGEQLFMYTILKSNAVNPALSRPDDGSYLLFKSLSHTYLFAAHPLRSSLKAFPGFTDYFTLTGCQTQVLKEKLTPGRYRIGVLMNQNNHISLAMTDRYVTFTSL